MDRSGEIHFGYDDDGLLTAAGTLARTFDPEGTKNGLLAGTILGSIQDIYGYSTDGLPAWHTTMGSGSPLYPEKINEHDALGQITKRTETLSGTSTVYEYTYDSSNRLETRASRHRPAGPRDEVRQPGLCLRARRRTALRG